MIIQSIGTAKQIFVLQKINWLLTIILNNLKFIKMTKFVLTLASILLWTVVNSQTVVGKWKTIDDETGKAKSIVEVTIVDGKLYGKIIQLLDEKDGGKDKVCTACPGDRKGKKIVGMTIISGLDKDGSNWEADDAILDPKNGKIYDCTVWLDGNNKDILHVRGYIGFFYRTQDWHRVK